MTRLIEVRQCSITDGGTQCVVNASNETAKLGGGVSRALFTECGGAVLQDEMSQKLHDEFDGRLDEGDCLVTSAGTSARFRFVLHVPSVDYSGPRARLDARGGVEHTVTSPERVAACVEAALLAAIEIAEREGRPTSVTFPILGAGSGSMSPGAAFRSMLKGLGTLGKDSPVERVVFAVPEPERFELCQRLLAAWRGM